jgi:hypothetical protein
MGRCRRLGHCGYIDCVCDVDPTDPRDMAALRREEEALADMTKDRKSKL